MRKMLALASALASALLPALFSACSGQADET